MIGRLIIFEGPDNVGRSTHSKLLCNRLEANGIPTLQIGLARSDLLGSKIKKGSREIHDFGPKTRTLLYTTDLVDQVQHKVIPALNAGFVVVADRYKYTPIIREELRGVDRNWSENNFQFIPTPDKVIILDAGPRRLLNRLIYSGDFIKINHYESGMDIGYNNIPTLSFLEYQEKLRKMFRNLAERENMKIVSTKYEIMNVHNEVWSEVLPIVKDLIVN